MCTVRGVQHNKQHPKKSYKGDHACHSLAKKQNVFYLFGIIPNVFFFKYKNPVQKAKPSSKSFNYLVRFWYIFCVKIIKPSLAEQEADGDLFRLS